MKIFRYALVILGLTLMSSHAYSQSYIAYDLSTGVPPPPAYTGNQAFGGTVGMQFDVNAAAIRVTSLGVFDSKGDGFHSTITAYIFNRDTQALVASVPFNGSADTLIGYNRFKTIGNLILNQGHYVIAAGGFTSADPLGNVAFGNGFIADTFNSGGGAISAVGDGVYADDFAGPGAFPNHSQGGSGSLAFNAGTFTYSLDVPEPGSVALMMGMISMGGSLTYRRARRRVSKKSV